MLDLDKVYLGDCLEVMNSIDDDSIDMVLCDLPYGITAPKWDEHIDIVKLWEQYKRIVKATGCVVLFASQPYTTLIINSNLKNYRYCWYWIKNQGTNFFHAKRMPIRRVEEIVVFGKGKYRPQITDGHIPTSSAKGCTNGTAYSGDSPRNYVGGSTKRFPTNVLEFKCVDNYSRLHSAEKPVDLCEYLIRTYTDEGDIVLDNAAGSGTTGIACIRSNRRFIMIEKDPGYVEVINKRMEDIHE